MSAAPRPANEASRLQALARCAILDTPSEVAFDEIASLAAEVCQTPSALITLVDERRQWFKSRVSFEATETIRELSFCAHAILEPEVMVIADATQDPRFADNPYVTGAPHVRFYAGAPLVLPGGQAVGTLAVIDYVPRALTEMQQRALRSLSHQVVAQLELHRRLADERQAQADRVERAVADSESQMGALLESSLDAIVAIDHRGRIVEFNPAAEEMFGLTRAAALGQDLAEVIIPPSLREQHRRGFARYLATREGPLMNRRIETTALRGDGTEFPVELTIARLGRTEPVRFAGFIRDLTEKKRSELAAQHGTERFQLVARATNDVVWDWDLHTHALWWNEGFQTLFGYRPEEIEPGLESWTLRIHPDDLARVKERIFEVIDSGGAYWTDEYRFRRSDGSYAEILDRGYVLRDPNGAPVRMIGAMMDITERKLAQEQVRQSEERYRELVEDVREAIFTIGWDGALTSVNRAGERILGWSREEWVGRPYLLLVHDEDRGLATEVFQRVMRGEKPESFELRLISSTGAPIALEFTVTPRTAGGGVVGVLGVGRDISERKRLEEQLRQSQKMDAIGQLSGGVAHDFNNLLTVIQCNAVAMATHAGRDVKECADEIVQATERAASLTRQLLLFSRKQVMRVTRVELNEVASSMTRMLGRVLDEQIQLRTVLGADLPPIQGDVGMIEQIFLNLIVNARDAMPRGGTLTVETSRELVDRAHAQRQANATPGQCVCLRVGDTGSGISAEILPRIFEPFFTTKEVGKGTGLGLATVYGIVKQHHGWIEVTTSDAGTTFSVYLPADDDTRSSARLRRAADTTRPLTGTETILVVEDEAAVRQLVVNLLERCGYQVLQAGSGADALTLWQRRTRPIDLLLTDLVMPGGLSGRGLAERLRGDDPHLKVVYCSGYSADAIGQGESLVEGINFLQKPFHPDQVARIVRELLDRR